ncbi:protein O-glucosyltransferase 2 [Nilaparvata lugens]|uniref:protein O-glucosyltransferase 2 n=1 Tax=Nilaparvata lugens TaxID=108931 RepID=UPI00193CDE8D|nr:protein O-glucosyltransferase 2 [Nilaparvata lugens]
MIQTFLVLIICSSLGISESDINIFGPGLNPAKVVMPARYFFLNLESFKKSMSIDEIEKKLSVQVFGQHTSGRSARIWVNVLNRNDGLFVVRYKLYETCKNLQIVVKFNNKHINGSPFVFNETIQAEHCYCPERDFESWLTDYGCLNNETNYSQIEEDLKPFKDIDFNSFRPEFVKKFDRPASMSVCNYVVLNNQLYRKCYGQHVGFKMFMDAILLSLTRKVRLPDFEIFVNLGDWPLMKKGDTPIYPLFSWCGSHSTHDIVMPTYDITESSLQAMGRVSLDMLSVQGNINKVWNDREAKAFWRGRDSSEERLKLIEISRQHPHLINASLTNFFFFHHLENQYGPKTKHISFFKFFDYKYQINLDGTVAAYRFPYLLSGGSLILKQDSEYYEHFYRNLKPKQHYVAVKRDLSNLIKKIDWARENDEKAEKIAKNGQQFALNNLLPQHIFCYHAVLFHEWSKKIVSPIRVNDGMEQVPQPSTDDDQDCFCDEELPETNTMKDEL